MLSAALSGDEYIREEWKSCELLPAKGMVRDYFGADKVVPIYVEVEDGDRLLRAIAREKKQDIPKYEEMCRRFLADAKDFSEENIQAAGITRRFYNANLLETIAEIKNYIQKEL